MDSSGDSGFSLIETMIAVGIGAIAMLGLMQLIDNTNKAQRNTASYAEFNVLGSTLLLVLSNEDSCKKALLDSSSASAVFNPDTPPPASRQLALVALAGSALAQVGMKFTDYAVSKLDLTEVDPTLRKSNATHRKYVAKLRFELKTASGRTRSRDFNLTVITDASTDEITRCSTQDLSLGSDKCFDYDNCKWSPTRHYSSDQNDDCRSYFGPGFVMTNYDGQKDNGYIRRNSIQCCKLIEVPCP